MSGFRSISTAFAVLLSAQAAFATSTAWWIVDTAEELLEGRGFNVEVMSDGRLRPIAGWTAGAIFDEPVVMAAAVAADGSLMSRHGAQSGASQPILPMLRVKPG